MQRPFTYGPRSVMVIVTELPFFLLVTFTLELNGSDLCAAVILLSSSGIPLAVFVPGCEGSPVAYTDAMQSSARVGMTSRQSNSVATSDRMSWLFFTGPDPCDRSNCKHRFASHKRSR